MHEALVIALGSPVRVGVYASGCLIEHLESEAQSSEALPALFETILSRYTLSRLLYVNGPGSFMAIKVSYLFLKTVSIVKGIPLLAADAFCFNGGQPVKAVGKLYFVKMAGKIETQTLAKQAESHFELPRVIDYHDFSDDAGPKYRIGAVG